MRFVHDKENGQDGESAYEPLNEDLGWLRGVCERRGIPVIRRDTERIIVQSLREKDPKHILEIGTAIGYSACLLAAAAPHAAVTTIEIDPRSFCDAKEAIARLSLEERIEQILGDAADVLLQLIREGRTYDIALIDAAKSHYRTYFEGALAMMGKGGLILCDNLMLGGTFETPAEGDRRHRTSAKRMERFLEELKNDDRVMTVFYELGDGLSVSTIL